MKIDCTSWMACEWVHCEFVDNMKDTVLLTGITGNLGSWLAVELLRQGKRVLALTRDTNSRVAAERLNQPWQLNLKRRSNVA